MQAFLGPVCCTPAVLGVRQACVRVRVRVLACIAHSTVSTTSLTACCAAPHMLLGCSNKQTNKQTST